MDSSTLFTLAFTIPLILFFWTLSSTTSSPFGRSFPRLYNKRICLLIAHPDDEAMFFAPTVLALTKPELGNHLKILCFSSGDADGLGHVRKKELQDSAKHLGVRNDSDVFIVDDPYRFPDSMTKDWEESDVASILASAFAPELAGTHVHPSSKKKQYGSAADGPPFATIDVLVTFDKHGISNHPNHRSLYHGAIHFLRTLMKDKPGYSCPVTLYTLSTTNIVRKYAGIFDAPVTMFTGALANLFSGLSGSLRKSKNQPVDRLLFISSINEWIKAQRAMIYAHKSQMAWFRWGWISIGRYMAVNDLKRVKI